MNLWPADVHVLIPAYRSVSILGKWIPRLLTVVCPTNVCVVDDASGDGTERLCQDLGIPVIRHEINKGKGGALSTGFKALLSRNASWIISMDADGQHAIEDLPAFLQATQSTHGLIIGYRAMRPGVMPLSRILSNRITSGILSILSGAHVLDSQCGYRAYSARLLRDMPMLTYQRFEMESEVILRTRHLGHTIGWIPVQTLYYRDGKSHISHLRDTLRWIRAVAGVYRSLRRSHSR